MQTIDSRHHGYEEVPMEILRAAQDTLASLGKTLLDAADGPQDNRQSYNPERAKEIKVHWSSQMPESVSERTASCDQVLHVASIQLHTG